MVLAELRIKQPLRTTCVANALTLPSKVTCSESSRALRGGNEPAPQIFEVSRDYPNTKSRRDYEMDSTP